ncbi:MAG: HAMP domain-containing histidine kinase [Actinobacteria bacterium]|nr:HAMP domain-containing histidine kinase [Actinomycetota bacterium]MBI3686483.1 HAMP domain-containing histidine kinase [Actinomycetota bacterium]
MRRQLTALVAATTSLVLIAFLVPITLLLRSEAEKRAISAATLKAESLAPLAFNLADGPLPSSPDEGFVVTVFEPDGRIVGAPAERTPSVALAASGEAFAARTRDGVEVLVPAQTVHGGAAVIRVLIPGSALYGGVLRASAVLAGLGLVLFTVGLVVADALGRRLVRSVRGLATAADRLSAGDMSARVPPAGPPEIRQAGAGLNRLAVRIAELLASEREGVADLAHRLRTPLTAIRLDAEAVRDPQLMTDIDQLERTIDEMIRTARRPVREGVVASADLVDVVRVRVGFWSVLAEDTGRPMSTYLPPMTLAVRTSPTDVAAAVDALLGNVFAHTPDGMPLQVTIRPQLKGAVLVVDDGGPGFGNLADLQRGRSGSGSTGLGLDVARRTVEAAGGFMAVGRSPLGGARVELHFGPSE